MRHFLIAGMLIMALGGNVSARVLSAVESGDHDGLVQALAADNSIDEKNAQGQTALLVAVWKNDVEAARLCLKPAPTSTPGTVFRIAPFLWPVPMAGRKSCA